jgi:alpha-1,2-mannosyltransferase
VALAGACYLASAVACCVLAARHHDGFGDLFIYRSAGRAVLGGAPLYQLRFAWNLPFTYPPFAAVVFVPLAWLPWPAVPPLVMAANAAALPLTLFLALRLPPARSWLAVMKAASPARREARRPAGQAGRLGGPDLVTAVTVSLLAASAATWLEPVRTNLAYGQVNLLIAVLILTDLGLPDGSRFKGAAIGVAAGLKLTPAIFAVYLLLTRRYRAAATSAAAAGLTMALAAVLLPGDSAAFWDGVFADPARTGRVENAANQSLRGALARFLHTGNVHSPWLIVAAVIGVAGLATAALAGRRGDEASGFARCAVTGLLISPVSWSHHWVLAVPVLLLGCIAAWRNRSFPALAALAVAAGAGWTAVIWQVPIGARTHAELHLNPLQLLAADAYVLAGLVAIAVAAGQELAWARRHGPAVGAVAGEMAGRAAGPG